MKKKQVRASIIVGLVVCLGLVSSTASAGGHLEFAGGLAIPTGELDELYNTGYSFAASYIHDMTGYLGLGVNIGYSQVPLDYDAARNHIGVADDYSIKGGEVSTQNICAEARFKTPGPGPMSLWAALGGGLYVVRIADRYEEVAGPEGIQFPAESQAGGYFGAGLTLPVSPKIQIGAEGKLNVFPLEHELRREVVDSSRTMLTLRVGLSIAP